MDFKRMPIEAWFDDYQYEIEYDIGESGVKFRTLGELGFDLSHLELRYGHHRGDPKLRALIAQDYGELSPKHIAVTTGASEANFAIIAALTSSGDHVLIEHPNYPSLYEVPRSLGRHCTLLPLDFKARFKPDIAKIESMIKPNTKLISLTHPNNPTGSNITETELEQLIELVEAHNIHLLLDETYRELSFGKTLPPAASLSPNAISITSMSKAYGLPGIRIGWVVADPSIIAMVRAVREQITICNSSLGEAVTFEVLKKKQIYLADIKKQVIHNFNTLKSWMNSQSNLEWVVPEGGVVCFPRFTDGKDTDQFCQHLVEKYRTFVVPGSCFEMPQHFRLGFGGAPLELQHGLSKLKNAIDDYTTNESN